MSPRVSPAPLFHNPLPRQVAERRRVPLSTYRGLRFGLVLHPQLPAEVYLQGALTSPSGLLREHQGPGAIRNAVERLASAYGSEWTRMRQDLAIAESPLRDDQERLGQPFVNDALLA